MKNKKSSLLIPFATSIVLIVALIFTLSSTAQNDFDPEKPIREFTIQHTDTPINGEYALKITEALPPELAMERAKDFIGEDLYNERLNREGLPPCELSGDYVFIFENHKWSNVYNLSDNLVYHSKTRGIEIGSKFQGVGGGYNVYGNGVYHICVTADIMIDITISSIVENVSLNFNGPLLYKPALATIIPESNKLHIYWSTHPDDYGTSTLIFHSYDNQHPILVEGNANDYIDGDVSNACDGTQNTVEVSYNIASTLLAISEVEDPNFDINDKHLRRSAWSRRMSYEYECDTDTPIPQNTLTPTFTPTPNNNCPTDGREGVYFFANTNFDYQEGCVFSTDNISNFASTIGDNTLSSIEIIGDWKVELFEDANYGGLHDTYHSSVANLDVNSLGGQYSSAKVESTEQTCPTDGSEGAYLYSNRNYDGRCTFTTGGILDLGNVEVGNNDLSSIQVIGAYECKIYEHENYEGLYDVIGSDDPDLDVRSLGGKYSSIQCYTITIIPTETPTPTPTPAPVSLQLLNPTGDGGFENGNTNGWIQSGGTIEIGNDNPYSGQYHLWRTAAEEAHIIRVFDISQYANEIDLGLGSAHFSAQVDVGKSENYRVFIETLDTNGNVLSSSDPSWKYHPGGYQEVSGVISVLPPNTRQIQIQIGMKRSGGDYTDVDVDFINLTVQFGVALPPTPTPSSTLTPTSTPPIKTNSAVYLPLVLHNFPPTYFIAGRVIDSNNNGILGVTITTNSGESTITDSTGNYTLSGLTEGVYSISPSMSGYIFVPSSFQVNVPPDITQRDFVALAISTSTPTPTTTPEPQLTNTPTPSPAPCKEIIVNGSFEWDGSWQIPSSSYTATYDTAIAHSGDRSMRIGIIDPADNVYSYSSTSQWVQIPADATEATLELWLYPTSGDAPLNVPAGWQMPNLTTSTLTGDAQYVLVYDTLGQQHTLLYQNANDQLWMHHQFDLRPYAGQAVQLYFGVYNDGWSGTTGMYVDDVSLEICQP